MAKKKSVKGSGSKKKSNNKPNKMISNKKSFKKKANSKQQSASIKKNETIKTKVQKSLKTKYGRIKTGIANLDPLIDGGLKEKNITLVVGDAGSGKTIFGIQFLLEGLKQGESCLYITFEERKDKLYDDMLSFKWDLETYEKNKKLFFLEYNPEQVKSLIEEGGGTIDQLITKNKISRLVIDSVTSFSLLYQDELSRKEAGLALFELINKWGCTAMLTSQALNYDHELKGAALEFEADGIILLYHSKIKEKRVRAIEILKMRGTKHMNYTLGLEISNKGMVINPSKKVNL